MIADFTGAIRVLELLTGAGFTWEPPGYYSLRIGEHELTLNPQVLNAGDFSLQVFDGRREPVLKLEVLVDVKPRPSFSPVSS